MPGPFAITPSSSTVPLDAKRTGTVTFTVKNTTRIRMRGVARVIATPPESAGWHSVIVPPVDPSPVQPTIPTPPISTAPVDPLMRDFAPEGTQVYTVQTTIPATAVPGEYKFRLIVANEANPDDEFTESAEVSFSVAPAPPPKPPGKFPFWIIPVIIVLLVVIGVAIALLSRDTEPEPLPTETPTLTAVPPTDTLTPTATSTDAPTATPTRTATPVPTAFGGGTRGQLAFMSRRQGGGVPNIFLINVNGSGGVTRLTFPAGTTSGNSFSRGHNAWSPDGSQIAFICNNPDRVCIMNADGSGLQVLADYRGGSDPDLSWASDGSKIIFNCLLSGSSGSQVCQVNLSTLAVSSLSGSETDDFDPDISPNGSQIAFAARRGGLRDFNLFTMNANGSNVQQITNAPAGGDGDPDWSPDGSSLAFERNDQLFVVTVSGGVGVPRRVGTSTGVRNPNWSPDGTQIAYDFNCDDDGIDCDIGLINVNGSGFRVLDGNSGSDWGVIWRTEAQFRLVRPISPIIIAPNATFLLVPTVSP